MNNEIKSIKSRSFLSGGSLILQNSYSAVLGFTAFFILTFKSGVYLLGIYNTVLAMMSFFNYLTDLGLAAAVMQKKDVEETDLNTVFYIQLLLSVIAIIVGFFLTNHIFGLYKDLPHAAVYLYWAVLASFFFLSLKTIPSVLLEKKIEIYKVVFVQAVENTLFYICVIVFSLLNFEIYSLIIAVLVRSIVGVTLMYYLNPWFPKFIFSFQAAKKLLKYGLAYQSNSILALIKDDLLIIYLGGAIGLKNLGYVTFGKKYAEFSIRLITDSVNRVAFPLFSRFQQDKPLLRKSLEKILFYETLLIFPIIIGAVFVFDSLLKLFPGYFVKWGPALFSFYFFSASAFFVSLSTPFINVFNAVGKVKITVYFMILWTALIWGLVNLCMNLFGYNGISVGFFLMSLSFVLVIYVTKKYVEFSLSSAIKTPLMATGAMAIYLVVVRYVSITYLHNIYLHVGLSIIGSVLIYFLIISKIKGESLFKELMEFLQFKNA